MFNQLLTWLGLSRDGDFDNCHKLWQEAAERQLNQRKSDMSHIFDVYNYQLGTTHEKDLYVNFNWPTSSRQVADRRPRDKSGRYLANKDTPLAKRDILVFQEEAYKTERKKFKCHQYALQQFRKECV